MSGVGCNECLRSWNMHSELSRCGNDIVQVEIICEYGISTDRRAGRIDRYQSQVRLRGCVEMYAFLTGYMLTGYGHASLESDTWFDTSRM